MEGVVWRKFKGQTPKNGSTIIIEDHEGNRAIGTWNSYNGFSNLCCFPIGKLVKWSTVQSLNIGGILGDDIFLLENGNSISPHELYDYSEVK